MTDGSELTFVPLGGLGEERRHARNQHQHCRARGHGSHHQGRHPCSLTHPAHLRPSVSAAARVSWRRHILPRDVAAGTTNLGAVTAASERDRAPRFGGSRPCSSPAITLGEQLLRADGSPVSHGLHGRRFRHARVDQPCRRTAFSFVFGVPDGEILAECRRRGIVAPGAATTVDEALALEEGGGDVVVASGFEGGGHKPFVMR